MELSYKEIIIKTLELKRSLDGDEAWVRGYNLEKVQTSFGWLGSSGSRRARELAAEGKIESRVRDGYAEYRSLKKEGQLALVDNFIGETVKNTP